RGRLQQAFLELVDVLRASRADIVRHADGGQLRQAAESHIALPSSLLNTVANSHILDQLHQPSTKTRWPTSTAQPRRSGKRAPVRLRHGGACAGTGGTACAELARKLEAALPRTALIIGLIRWARYWLSLKKRRGLKTAPHAKTRGPPLAAAAVVSAFDCALRARSRFWPRRRQSGVVVLLPDSVRNYMTKFLSDDWMIEQGHMPDPEDDPSLGPSHTWMSVRVGSLDLRAPLTVAPDVSVSETLELFNRESIDQLLNGPSGAIVGMATLSNITSRIYSSSLAPTDPVGSAAFDKFTKVTPDAKLGAVSRRLDTDHFVLVVQQQRQFGSAGEAVREFVYGILTRIDLLNFILKMQE
uniref:CBS domain-containing protein n=1 Tax=Macrostomum lignano TaxID=282301 RepID=A0A1I8F7Z0_9PLAT